ncbi:MAG: EF-hand domain-containing protein [Sphingomonadales bacterium]|nr:MAG: EF-hand domain-containing protein [Sphingomonadales bacterium]
MMRALILGTIIAAGMTGHAAAQDGRLFVSPMGEPFRGQAGGPAPQDQWFDAADTNKDGALTLEEVTADAARFFATLDMRGDGEIDPDDIERYESQVLPEISGGGAMREPRSYMKGDGSGPRTDNGFGSPRADSRSRRDAKKGAARFSYLDFPQPITVADRNFNRGVDKREFANAAETRFGVLDSNGDGRIEKRELPKLPPVR